MTHTSVLRDHFQLIIHTDAGIIWSHQHFAGVTWHALQTTSPSSSLNEISLTRQEPYAEFFKYMVRMVLKHCTQIPITTRITSRLLIQMTWLPQTMSNTDKRQSWESRWENWLSNQMKSETMGLETVVGRYLPEALWSSYHGISCFCHREHLYGTPAAACSLGILEKLLLYEVIK